MKELKNELERLQEELKNVHLSKDRVLEIKKETLVIAKKIDSSSKVSNLVGTIKELYRAETKYPKRRVNKAVSILLDYISSKEVG